MTTIALSSPLRFVLTFFAPPNNHENEVFEKLDEFESHGCSYLIAYIADITWGNTVEILKEKL